MIKLKELLNENILDNILKNKNGFSIEIGSGTEGHNKPSREYVLRKFEEFILHYWMDMKFYHNETDNPEEYEKAEVKEILKPYMKNLDKFVSTWMEVDKKGLYKIKRKYNTDFFESLIDKYVKNSKQMSKQTKQDYYDYRLRYAGVKVK